MPFPPIKGAPWLPSKRPSSGHPYGYRLPGPGAPSLGKPFVSRMRHKDDNERLRRAIDQLSVMANSLLASGELVMKDQNTFTLRGGAFTDDRAPTATDDESQGIVVGALWVDTTTRYVYVCVENGTNGALWTQVG